MLTNHTNYNCVVETDQGEAYKIYANFLHNEGLDCWKDWYCEAGHERIFIDSEQTVYSGQCLNQNLGNLKTSWNLNEIAVQCTRDRCTGCTDDLIITKRNYNDY